MMNNIVLLKSINQYIDTKGNVYAMSPNGNIDDMVDDTTFNISQASNKWWNTLSAYDLKLTDIIYGGISHGKS